eukprot:SAG31_NODE_24636_length_477_cov_0.976190_1_plen_23_part_01
MYLYSMGWFISINFYLVVETKKY